MFYLAYGSNLNKEQMMYRCPGAVAVSTAVIPDYQLLFKGSKTGAYLTIEQKAGISVPVGVWRVTEADMAALDRYEGYPDFYYRKNLKVKCADGRYRNCFVYIMDERRKLGAPSEWYMQTCLRGYDDFGFNPDILFTAAVISRRGEVA